ncbi:MAG: GMC family oxidoreductase N-terminal domain-containing protein [Pseudomonadota bacterium]
MEFDFIVVGAGSAGCALAHRLSADPGNRVALLEAGPRKHFLSQVPISFANLIDEPSANWCYRSEPEPGTSERAIPVPRGRLLGGSSSINGMVYVRGQQLDFDTWAQLGNRGWSYADVLPVFKRMEDYIDGGEDRGQGGPLRIGLVQDENPLYDALLAAGLEMGLPDNPDYNGAEQEGIVRTQATIHKGRRQSTAYAYLDPIRDRKNLTVLTGAEVNRVLLNGKQCTGVETLHEGRVKALSATREVILCGGAINSPKILELSGIGQPELLAEHGIEVQHALPGVGESLRDHVSPRMVFRVERPDAAYSAQGNGFGLVRSILRYAVQRRGLLSLPTAPVIGFIRTRPELATPDVQYHFVPYRVVLHNGKRGMGRDPAITITVNQCRPESLGSIHIKSGNPRENPAIRFNFLDAELDRRTLIDGMRFIRKLLTTQAMAGICGEEMQPGPQVESDEDLLQFMRDKAETVYHPVGTCKMGNDPRAVVDHELKVHGIANLRVADGSIMPTLTSGNTNAPCIMIGEKCADMVLAA